MRELLRRGIIGAATAGGFCLILSLLAMLGFTLAREVNPSFLLSVSTQNLLEWLVFLGLGIFIGFIIGFLWAALGIRGRKRRIFSAGIVASLAIGAVSLVVTPVRLTVTGWIHGEKCYRGLPASYWVGELRSACQPRTADKVEPQAQGLLAISAGRDIEYLLKVVGGHIKKDTVPGLMGMLNDPTPGPRNVAAATLARIGPEAAEAIPALIDVLKADPHPKVRATAAGALGRTGEAKGVVPILIGALKDGDPEVRSGAAGALRKFGPAAKEAVPALTEVSLTDGDRNVRFWAKDALKVIDPGTAKRARAK